MENQPKSIHEYTLDNGLKVIFRNNPKATTIIASIFYKVGAAFPEKAELVSVAGLALYDDQSNPWSSKYSQNTYSSKPDWRRLVYVLEETFESRLTRFAPEHIESALKYFAHEMTSSPRFPQEWIQDIYVKQHPKRRTLKKDSANTYSSFWDMAIPGSNWGAPRLISPSDAFKVTPTDVEDFHQRWLAPNNATLCIDANIPFENLKDMVDRVLGQVVQRHIPRAPIIATRNAPGERRMIKHGFTDGARLYMAFNLPTLTDNVHDVFLSGLTITHMLSHISSDVPDTPDWFTKHAKEISQITSHKINSRLVSGRAGAALLIRIDAEDKSSHSLKQLEDKLWALIEEIKILLPPKLAMEKALDELTNENQALDSAEWIVRCGNSAKLDYPITVTDNQRALFGKHTLNAVRDMANTYLTRDRVSVLYLLP